MSPSTTKQEPQNKKHKISENVDVGGNRFMSFNHNCAENQSQEQNSENANILSSSSIFQNRHLGN